MGKNGLLTFLTDMIGSLTVTGDVVRVSYHFLIDAAWNPIALGKSKNSDIRLSVSGDCYNSP